MPREKLSYDSALPPFLQRLHAQKAGRGDSDRREQPIARAKRAKDRNEDEGPTVVDESGETITKEEYEKLQQSNTTGSAIPDTSNITGAGDPDAEPKMSGALQESVTADQQNRPEPKVTDGTTQKKRKAAKIIGDDEEAQDDGGVASASKKPLKKAKGKSKPVKLTFEDEDDD